MIEVELEGLASPAQLLVEGKGVALFVEELIKSVELPAGPSEPPQIRDFGGVDELKRFLRAFPTRSGYDLVERIGIIRDAESSSEGAFASVQGSLRAAGMPVPDDPATLSAGRPRVGVMILPGDGRPGMLETLLNETVVGDPVNRCVDAFLDCVEERSGRVRNPDKAWTHAFLATRPRPDVSVGVAAQKNTWKLDHTALAPLRQFVREVASGR